MNRACRRLLAAKGAAATAPTPDQRGAAHPAAQEAQAAARTAAKLHRRRVRHAERKHQRRGLHEVGDRQHARNPHAALPQLPRRRPVLADPRRLRGAGGGVVVGGEAQARWEETAQRNARALPVPALAQDRAVLAHLLAARQSGEAARVRAAREAARDDLQHTHMPPPVPHRPRHHARRAARRHRRHALGPRARAGLAVGRRAAARGARQ